ncbi:protein disulfide-isomerase A6 homolog [Pomacea canaliculata]|uniref:protein disulfide-isomerase A6 homolog n=1 Tax=Pomacea canaliculata TaxID=400727 RepID=UPI000D739928|nr:protein disulfide-isomerase A6 homolog [Pomacea canaliculata]
MAGVLLLLLTYVAFSFALYSPGDDVIELTPQNFHSKVIEGDELWIIEFYAPWCGHCKALAPEWKKAATALKGIVRVGAVNADEHGGLGSQYGVTGFPTIKFFGEDKFKPTDYSSQRTASAIVDFAISQARSVASSRLSGKKSSGGSKSSGGNTGDPKDVVEITDSNFEEEVLNYDGMVLVEFYAPWCGHCKNLAPHWAQAATDLKGKVKVCAIDATVNTVMSNRYGIRGFPTIKMFPAGKKDGEAEDYDGGRTASDIVQWALDKLAENVPPPELKEIVSSTDLQDNCEGRQLCIISVLPQLLDCQSKCRNDYLDILRTLGEKFKKNLWGWLWTEAGAQSELEESLDIGGSGYPALAAVNLKKMKYSPLRGPFSEKGIHEFLRDLSYGKGSTAPLRSAKLPKLNAREPWDGKDAEMPEEEDIDLSDIDFDDESKDEL